MRSPILPFTVVLLAVLMAASASAGWGDALKQAADDTATSAGAPYTPTEAVTGIKEVLALGADSAVSTLGAPGGFSSSQYALPLPDPLSGLTGNSSGLLSAMNLAAEATAGSSGNMLMDAIQALSVGNYAALLGGGEDAITRFFESSARSHLRELIKPVAGVAMEKAGVGDYLSAMMAGQSAGVAGGFDMGGFIADRTLDGIFAVMAVKEKDIRASNGVGTTDLLQKLF